VWTGAFIDRMDLAYCVSDLVVCRAGATTIAELTRLGKPAILVPYPYAAAGHQMENARTLAEAGAAAIIEDHDAKDRLEEAVRGTLKGSALAAMGAKSKSLGRPDAARDIARRMVILGGGGKA
jgi:UDP-N-acetylglucosamine--N-acetylmuramyl-(pentapeptide) pyrophosphoryl-undecaprenol N-acetylglucosamine transferase